MNIIKGDDCDFELTFKDVDGNVIDITDATVFFTVKKKLTDSDDDAVIKKEITDFADPTSGIAILTLTDTDTEISARSYYFDIQLKDNLGKITSTQAGKLIVSQDVTERTAIDIGS